MKQRVKNNIRWGITTAALKVTVAIAITSCAATSTPKKVNIGELSIPYEKYTLENGLDVILHVDRSDPIVAINLAAHVGSARETPGRTGFAHLFEHLLFLDSENLGYGGLDEMNARIGGDGTNGFTSTDMTSYYQVVPADGLEKIIWAEADKLGFFINTVTQDVIDNEKLVVQNEKREVEDNQPYGHAFYVIGKALYPDGHPYNWQIIGSLADLDAATLQDAKDFYRRWYVPNNVTVSIAGDFDVGQAKIWVEKYFGEIPRGKEITPLKPRPAILKETKSLYHEDNFATVPQLMMTWPAVEQYHPDMYALNVLTEHLVDGKNGPLNQVLLEEQKLASEVGSFVETKEIAGEIYLIVNANKNQDLDKVVPAIKVAFNRFEKTGISQADLDRIKAGLEVQFYNNITDVVGKATSLIEDNIYQDNPGFSSEAVKNTLAVSADDVMRVYDKYIKGKPYIVTSFVPKGQPTLALEGAAKAHVVEEEITQDADASSDSDTDDIEMADFDFSALEDEDDIAAPARNFKRTPSSFDRSKEPPFGDPYEVVPPKVWRAKFNNGTKIYGIHNDETPLISISLSIDAGRNRGSVSKAVTPTITAEMLEKGTARKTAAELENAIKALGGSISITGGDESVTISAVTTVRNFEKTAALIEEMLLEPRWDKEELAILKRLYIGSIDEAKGDPDSILDREQRRILYPADHIFSQEDYGTEEGVNALTMDDLKAFYATNYAPAGSAITIVGDISRDRVKAAFKGLAERWDTPAPDPIKPLNLRKLKKSTIHFYDVPGSKQSVILAQRPSIDAYNPDYPILSSMNFQLGGAYTSLLNEELRVNKGYTYGINSYFSTTSDHGVFAISTNVRTDVTKEAIALIHEIVSNYGPNFTQKNLDSLKKSLLRQQALEFETPDAKLSYLNEIADYGYSDDYRARNVKRLEALTLKEFKTLAKEHFSVEPLDWIVVGDAKTQLPRLKELGFAEVKLLNKKE